MTFRKLIHPRLRRSSSALSNPTSSRTTLNWSSDCYASCSQWPHFCNIRRNILPNAQHKALRRVHAEWAEFIDVSWLLVHRRFETPPIKGSATPERKYPEYQHHAASEADHPASNRAKLRRARAPAGNLLGRPI